MDTHTTAIIEYITHQKSTMIEQLQQYCCINSGSTNLDGLSMMSKVLKDAFAPIADTIDTKKLPTYFNINMLGEAVRQKSGDGLLIKKRPELTRRVLLCGHMDTVYGTANNFQACTTISANKLNGPGVADMKGGLIVMLYALYAFEQSPYASVLGWDVFINSDEELGSPGSHLLLDHMAHKATAALVYEPSMDDIGTFVRNRKGSAKLTMIVFGKTAHAGRDLADGRNAICYLAQIITQINQLNNQRPGISINIGMIHGGDAINVVPGIAVAKFDVRITSMADELWIWRQLDNIMSQNKQNDYQLKLHGTFSRPVRKTNIASKKIFRKVQHLGQQIGLTFDWRDSGGCSDGNNLARYGIPVLDTLGVYGGNLHSPQEYVVLESLTEKTILSFLLLQDMALGGLEELAA